MWGWLLLTPPAARLWMIAVWVWTAPRLQPHVCCCVLYVHDCSWLHVHVLVTSIVSNSAEILNIGPCPEGFRRSHLRIDDLVLLSENDDAFKFLHVSGCVVSSSCYMFRKIIHITRWKGHWWSYRPECWEDSDRTSVCISRFSLVKPVDFSRRPLDKNKWHFWQEVGKSPAMFVANKTAFSSQNTIFSQIVFRRMLCCFLRGSRMVLWTQSFFWWTRPLTISAGFLNSSDWQSKPTGPAAAALYVSSSTLWKHTHSPSAAFPLFSLHSSGFRLRPLVLLNSFKRVKKKNGESGWPTRPMTDVSALQKRERLCAALIFFLDLWYWYGGIDSSRTEQLFKSTAC